MAIKYINSRGDTYYLHEGKTKTGKPKYFFSMKKDGVLVDSIPAGYEIYENPNAQVFLRKILPKIFTDEEINIVENIIKKCTKLTRFKIDIKGNKITVFLPDQDIDSLKQIFSTSAYSSDFKLNQLLSRVLTYSPMMRFVLVNEKKRIFQVERMCFLGSIDDWIFLDESSNLAQLVERYAGHLGKESFFDLM
ncbi:hypothetical protein AC481_05930 [miscellaneous Crenarchaeota group archaeon SMTZ-80]|nr:MAG: hypothetical protein AC481_05930 [miscellaneous Crenarchaeota group archaeon SMTZ-80]